MKSHLTIPLTVMGSVVGGIGFSSFRSTRVLPEDLIPRLRLVGDIFTMCWPANVPMKHWASKSSPFRKPKKDFGDLPRG